MFATLLTVHARLSVDQLLVAYLAIDADSLVPEDSGILGLVLRQRAHGLGSYKRYVGYVLLHLISSPAVCLPIISLIAGCSSSELDYGDQQELKSFAIKEKSPLGDLARADDLSQDMSQGLF